MKERPILFSGPMVRALLDGTKTQARWVIKDPNPYWTGTIIWPPNKGTWRDCPYGQPGDRLWVRETWRPVYSTPPVFTYRATPDMFHHPAFPWRSSIFMPRKACRVVLEITSIRVERVASISEADASAEGVEKTPEAENLAVDPFRNKPSWRGYMNGERAYRDTAKESYQSLWDSLNAKRGFGWATNPWVWVISFKRLPDSAEGRNEPGRANGR